MKILTFHQIFLENAFVLSQLLKIPLVQAFEPKDNELYIIFGAHESAVELYDIQLKIKVKYIILNSESQESNFLKNKYYLQILKNNYVLGYSKEASTYLLNSFNIHTLSYFNFYFFNPQPESAYHQFSIDRLFMAGFIGSITDRRKKIINEISSIKDMSVYIDYQSENHNAQKMKNTLSQCTWIINIPFFNHKNFEKHRINNALACGCNVVSLSDSLDEETIKEYEDYIYITDDLVEFFKKPPTIKKKTYIEFFNCNYNLNLIKQNKWLFEKINSSTKI